MVHKMWPWLKADYVYWLCKALNISYNSNVVGPRHRSEVMNAGHMVAWSLQSFIIVHVLCDMCLSVCVCVCVYFVYQIKLLLLEVTQIWLCHLHNDFKWSIVQNVQQMELQMTTTDSKFYGDYAHLFRVNRFRRAGYGGGRLPANTIAKV